LLSFLFIYFKKKQLISRDEDSYFEEKEKRLKKGLSELALLTPGKIALYTDTCEDTHTHTTDT